MVAVRGCGCNKIPCVNRKVSPDSQGGRGMRFSYLYLPGQGHFACPHSVAPAGGWLLMIALLPGGHAWWALLWGDVHGCSRGRHAWLLLWGVCGCPRGACVVARGGCMVAWGACVVASRGVWGHAWLLPGGACMVAHAWVLPGVSPWGMVAPGGACVVARGGCAWLSRGACMVALGGAWLLRGHAWVLCGWGHAWLSQGGAWLLAREGVHGCSGGACMRYATRYGQ